MCGLVGFMGGRLSRRIDDGRQCLEAMAGAIAHRGPDSEGFWQDVGGGIALAHRRLAIVDLSPAGDQPMHSPSGRYVLIYNGEIYNHAALRTELDQLGRNFAWRGQSDTETLLAGFDRWGIEDTLERAIGMFAFALWDRADETLTLARDRAGEKPLYYGWQGSGDDRTFVFGSELKSLSAHPSFARTVNRGALSLFMRHGYVPAPYSIFEDIHKLDAGCLLSVSLANDASQIRRFWSAAKVAEGGVASPYTGSGEQAVGELEDLLLDAVGKQMMSDVPLGAFLSGGVDSSAIVALMQRQSSRPVKTFSIGFYEEGYNEAQHAKAVAAHLGTDHTELYVTPAEAMAVIPKLPSIYDEPFADSSQVPTYLVSSLARQHVTVSLSGDAGDELFGGYTRYHLTSSLWRKLDLMPRWLRRIAGRGLTAVPPAGWDVLAKLTKGVVPGVGRLANVGDKLHKGGAMVDSASIDELYMRMVSYWQEPAEIVQGAPELPTLLDGNAPSLHGLDNVQRMMALDLLTYLPDDILVKVDRAAMALSLETRVPFLDHRVVEFAAALPLSMKLRDGSTKWALREVLYRHVPRALIERPKMGFGVPIDAWLRGPLRDWAENLLDQSRLEEGGFLDARPIRRAWQQHVAGAANRQAQLWNVLMWQSWRVAHAL